MRVGACCPIEQSEIGLLPAVLKFRRIFQPLEKVLLLRDFDCCNKVGIITRVKLFGNISLFLPKLYRHNLYKWSILLKIMASGSFVSAEIPNIVLENLNQRELKKRLCADFGIDYPTEQIELFFGPSEQANPFFTVYSYSASPNLSPETLKEELETETEMGNILRKKGISAHQRFLTLKHDSFSSTGTTARYHLRLDYDPLTHWFFSVNQRKDLSLSDFGEVRLNNQKLLEIISVIRRFERERWAQLLTTDLLESGKKSTYYDFCVHFNQISLQRLSGQVSKSRAVDKGGLEVFPVEYIRDLERTYKELRVNQLVEEGEAIFRFLVETPKGLRFIRLAYEDPNTLKNLDKDIRHIGEATYSFREIQDISKKSLKQSKPRLFVCKSLEYLLLIAGLTPFLMGDDGVYSLKIDKIANFVKNRGIIPFYFTYCQENRAQSSPESLKEGDYIFNPECSINKFYESFVRHGK